MYLPKFDPSAAFVANRPRVINGETVQPGDIVAGLPDRLMRKLYEQRHLRMVERPVVAQSSVPTPIKRKK